MRSLYLINVFVCNGLLKYFKIYNFAIYEIFKHLYQILKIGYLNNFIKVFKKNNYELFKNFHI